MLHVLRFIIPFFISSQLYSQSFVYSKSYFRWPVNNQPGIVANFGELREGHWHMGLDILTDHKVNMPVLAAADGYIARISVHPFGYGQAIYINHPNGLTTVYGHLNKFFPLLDSVVSAAQYQQQSWEIEIEFTKDQLQVKKGQFIAFSGSTGGSQGPHVHFEIRDTRTERCINPLFFNLPIHDDVRPVITKLALYDRDLSVYDQHAILFPVKKVKDKYNIKEAIIKTGFSKLGFAIGAYDCISKSTNPNGIYAAQIFLDGQPQIEFVLDSMDYNETDYVNAHVDYKYKYEGGSYLQQLFRLPGDKGRAYHPKTGDGAILLKDTAVHSVRILARDIFDNSSELDFKIQLDRRHASLVKQSLQKQFLPNNANVFEQPNFEVYLSEDCLYDSVESSFRKIDQSAPGAVSAQFQFCTPAIPFHGKINIRIKPNRVIPADLQNKIVIKRIDKRSANYQKAERQQDWLAASFNDFGQFQAFADNEAPTISLLGKGDTVDLSSSKSIVLHTRDNAGIKNFRAELDGQWLKFSNDKAAAWIYNFDEHCPFGVHRLKIHVEDIVGNVAEKELLFKRIAFSSGKEKKTSGKKKLHKTKISK
ncbi:MAG TPA: M23 family metallopeptidase [Chitinophagaceae bacterium]